MRDHRQHFVARARRAARRRVEPRVVERERRAARELLDERRRLRRERSLRPPGRAASARRHCGHRPRAARCTGSGRRVDARARWPPDAPRCARSNRRRRAATSSGRPRRSTSMTSAGESHVGGNAAASRSIVRCALAIVARAASGESIRLSSTTSTKQASPNDGTAMAGDRLVHGLVAAATARAAFAASARNRSASSARLRSVMSRSTDRVDPTPVRRVELGDRRLRRETPCRHAAGR